MEPIKQGATGAAVEDIQARLAALGYETSDDERAAQLFGPSTTNAVARFRIDNGLDLGTEVDALTWATLVDEGYRMGDRTLYLRLPNFHGADVRQLQKCLNILGFSCGEADGYYGVHTEAAVKQFQESQGQLADGMAFPDTFDAIDRLHHVWGGKPAAGPHPMGGMGFARAAEVLERMQISMAAEDPISRNVAGRIWNLASATTDKSGLDLVMDTEQTRRGDQLVLVLATGPISTGQKIPNLSTDDIDTLPQRLRTAVESSRRTPPLVRLEMPFGGSYDGTFTIGDAQTLAVVLLDAICMAFE